MLDVITFIITLYVFLCPALNSYYTSEWPKKIVIYQPRQFAIMFSV